MTSRGGALALVLAIGLGWLAGPVEGQTPAAPKRRPAKEAATTPDLLHDAPTSQVVGRLDETAAVKNLDVCWRP